MLTTKLRLRAQISLQTCPNLFIRYNAGWNYPINSGSVRSLPDFNLQRVGWLNWTSHSSSAFDDDFPELGSQVVQDAQAVLKLITEKSERSRMKKTDSRKEISLTSPVVLGCSSRLKGASPKSDASDFKGSCSITVKNVPWLISLSKLKEATSTFGKILKASTMRLQSKRLDCYIEFESEESCRRAVSAGRITVDNCELLIYPRHIQNSTSESPLKKENDTLDPMSSKLDTRCRMADLSKESNNKDTDGCQQYPSLLHGVSTPVEITTGNNSNYDDDFAELGPQVEQGAQTVLKLMTEKPERLWIKKTDSRKEISLTSPVVLGCSSGLKGASLESDASDFKDSCSITEKNVPWSISLSKLKEEMSIFGKISKALCRRLVSKRLDCYIKFESEESCRRAVSAGRITVDNCELLIYPRHIQNSTSESPLKKENDTLDPVSSKLDKCSIKAISQESNNKDTNGCQRSPSLLHRESTPGKIPTGDNSKDQKDLLEISSQIADYKCKIIEKRMCAEDLDYLHHLIVHLEHHPLRNY